jgi:hypothetical protein
MIQEALEEARQLAHENRLEGKDLDELDALEEEEDEDFLEVYRYAATTALYAPARLTNASPDKSVCKNSAP